MGVLLALVLASNLGDPLAPGDAIHLTFELRAPDLEGMRSLVAAQQDPGSPEFRRYLTPAQFGERFGASASVYKDLSNWLATSGLSLETFPNRLVVEATGSAGQIERLLKVRLFHLPGRPASVHVPDHAPELPAALGSQLLIITGLDTSHQHRPRIRDSFQNLTFGPQDLRRYYNVQPLLDAGFAGAGAQLVILGIAETPENTADPVDVNYFYENVSNSRAVFSLDVLPNPSNDFTSYNARSEDELDVEMPTVGAPEASSVTLVMPPASEQFIAGPNEIVNNFPNATSVSTSWGDCEPTELSNDPNEPAGMRQLVIQGVLEGMTWSVASGDQGSDDCKDSSAPSVDFPGSIPEVLSIGGTQPTDSVWDQNDAIAGYEVEEVWNQGDYGGAGGGGFSVIFPPSAYQTSALPDSFWPSSYLPDAGRVVPDLALLSAPLPGVAVDDTWEQVLDITGGTSVAAPLSAGFLALLSDRLGCRLGDLHAALYAIGLAQLDGGPRAFHDVTVGTIALDGLAGADAGVGFDPASGWGSVDVNVLATLLPPCPPFDAGILTDAGQIDAGPAAPLTQDPTAYDPCGDLQCQSPTVCQTQPEGPSRCAVACANGNSSDCPAGTACAPSGGCVPGNPDGGQGAACLTPVDCMPALTCFPAGYTLFPNGYCAAECGEGFASCPAGTLCDPLPYSAQLCVTACDGGCADPTLVCQPQPGTGYTCLPPCEAQSDCDNYIAPGATCEPDSGVCEFLDGGTTSGGTTNGSTSTDGTGSTTSASSTSASSMSAAAATGSTSSVSTTGGNTRGTSSTSAGTSSSGTGSSGSPTTGSGATSTRSPATTSASGSGSGGPPSTGCSCASGGESEAMLFSLGAFGLLPFRRRRVRAQLGGGR